MSRRSLSSFSNPCRSLFSLFSPLHHHRRHNSHLPSLPTPAPAPPRSIARVFLGTADSTADGTRSTLSSLAEQILALDDGGGGGAVADVAPVLDSDLHAKEVLVRPPSSNGCPFLELLSMLKRRPRVALQIFHWRRNLPDSPPLTADDYASAVSLAGRARNLALAVKLFYESIPIASDPILYNALMAAFLYNGEVTDTLRLFDRLKKETSYRPDSVSYNILLSLYSFRTLVDHMESVLDDMDSSGVPRTVETYNTVMSGYLRSKRWNEMERIFGSLKNPDASTRLLMLRGYAMAGNLKKMEKMYKLVKEHVHTRDRSLIWAMICAYSTVRGQSNLRKIEELVELVRSEEYFPYLHVLLIKAYAKERSIDEMERLIVNAYKSNIVISSVQIMRTILAVYYEYGDVDRLDFFIKQAEQAGWRLFKDLYRCKMVLYSRLGRLREMCDEFHKMDSYWPVRDRYTLKVLYKGFSGAGRRSEMNMVIGLMFKYGFQFPRGTVVQ